MLMKNLLTILLFAVANIIYAQGSWLDVQVQTDQYAGESSWQILNENDAIVATSPPLQNNSLNNKMVFLPAGDYEFIMMDAFGDGICCQFGEGWYRISNSCGLDTAVYDFDTALDTIPFTLNPCIPPLPGCMDEASNNYNPWANIDNGTCNVSECDEGETLVSMQLTLDTWPNETGFTLVDLAVGEFYEQVLPGEFDFGDQLATYTYDFCVSLGFELILVDVFGDGLNGSASGGEDGACVITACDSVIWELEDLAFTSFDEGNTVYSGAIFTEPCPPTPDVYGCMDDDYVDYNPQATAQDTCITLHTWGCTNPEALNYDSTATIADLNSPCSLQIILEDDAGDGWGNSTIGMVQGEQQWLFTVGPGQFYQSWDITLDSDEKIDIYYFQAGNQQQSSQELAFQTLHNSVHVINEAGDTLLSEGSNPFINNGQGALQPFTAPNWTVYSFTPYCGDSCIPYIYGCIDETACNFDVEANTADECNYPVQYYDCDNFCVNDTDGDGVCDELEIVGCQDPTAFNYNENATDAGDCEAVVFGCTDPTQYNYDPQANTENDSCIPFLYGCTNPLAFNYDENANTDNGSCIEVVEGCADPEAYNYDISVNTPNNTACLYDAGCIGGPGVPYWLNDYCYSWVIEVDPYCCETGWDSPCVDLYQYCNNETSSIDLTVQSLLHFFPNPTAGEIRVQAPIGTLITIIDASGRKIIETQDTRIYLPSPGVYVIMANYKGRIKKETVVRQ